MEITEKTIEQKIEELEKEFNEKLHELKSEIKPKFKKGDFIYEDGRIMIVREYPNKYFSLCKGSSFYTYGEYGLSFVNSSFRLATESEKQLLIDKLHENGKDWDEGKCEIVDYRWRAEKGGNYYLLDTRLDPCETIDLYFGTDNYRYEVMNYFKTYELAEKASEKVKELLLTLKHS